MARIAIVCGLLLIGVGVGGWIATDRASWTALIPAKFGVVLILLGLLALKENLRKHAMHAAALIGLIGFVVPLIRVAPDLGKLFSAPEPKLLANVATSLICLVFVLLCVKSFIDARRARARREQSGA
jgi:hypothetical protein